MSRDEVIHAAQMCKRRACAINDVSAEMLPFSLHQTVAFPVTAEQVLHETHILKAHSRSALSLFAFCVDQEHAAAWGVL